MTDGAYVTQLLAAVFFLVVGVRLLRLSRRTGEAPEKLLGIYFFLAGWGYVGWLLPTIFHLEAMVDPIDLSAWALYSIGVIPFMLFARLVFRPDAAWANWMVRACTLLLIAGMAMWIVQGHDYYVIDSPWYWCVWLGYASPCIWVTIEAFVCYAGANRRVRVGLCDPIVANRYLLFGWFGVFQTFACITDILVTLDYTANQTLSGGLDGLLGAMEMAGIVMLSLAFFPPAFYQRWIVAPAASATKATDR